MMDIFSKDIGTWTVEYIKKIILIIQILSCSIVLISCGERNHAAELASQHIEEAIETDHGSDEVGSPSDKQITEESTRVNEGLPTKKYNASGAKEAALNENVDISGFSFKVNSVNFSNDYSKLYELLGENASSEIEFLKKITVDNDGISTIDKDFYKEYYSYIFINCTIKNNGNSEVVRTMRPWFYYKKDGQFSEFSNTNVLSFTGKHIEYAVPNVGNTAYNRYIFAPGEEIVTTFIVATDSRCDKKIDNRDSTIYISDSFLTLEKGVSVYTLPQGSHLIPIKVNE